MTVSWLGGLLTEVGWALGRRIAQFSRRRSEREVLEEQARWGRAHMGITPMNDMCVVCRQAPAYSTQRCPGPPATRAARAKLKAKYNVEVW